MPTIEDEQQVFKIGTQVEVTSNEHGLKNSWYKCTIIHLPTNLNNNNKKRKKNFYWVEYQMIVEEHDHSEPLKEYIHASFIRPLPPPPSACACTLIFDKFDVVEANYRDGWWICVIIQVLNDGLKYLVAFENPYEKLVFSRDQLRVNLSWLDGDKWTCLPNKNVAHFPQDGNQTVRAFQVKSIIAENKSSAKRLKQAISGVAEGRRSSGQKIDLQALAAEPLLQSCRLFSSEGNTNCNSEIKVSLRDSCCSEFLSPNNIQGNNKKSDSKSYKKKRRDYPTKKALHRFLKLLQHGEESGESDAMHESATDQTWTCDAAVDADSHYRKFTEEVQVTEIVDEINDFWEVVDEQGHCQTKEIVWYPNPSLTERSKPHPATFGVNIQSDESQRKELVFDSNPAITGHSKPHPAALGANSQSDKSHNWPFTKRSEMWKVIESMEVFKRIVRMPHFSPLNEHEKNSSEMFAICMMMKFSYEVERITGFPDALQNTRIIRDSLDNLEELRSHGFSTILLQVYLTELLEKVGREEELQENLEEVSSDIRKCQAEKIEAERKFVEVLEQMKSLRQQIKYFESEKYLEGQELAKLESGKGLISRELHRLRLTKKRHPFRW